ncbi:hypothetical protein T484DRAFT_1957723 [Baffinella frigidus]|nr:hypothetical protein T484DRAFT_1957723 [Cryptophyta sp. CCMP2293]
MADLLDAFLDPDLGEGEHPIMADFVHSFMDPDEGEEEPLDAFHIDRIKVEEDRRFFEHFAPMLERLERNERDGGDVNAFYSSFPCAPHMRSILHGGGQVLVDPWKRDFTCFLPKKGGVGAPPAKAKMLPWMNVMKINKEAAFRVDQGSFSTFKADPRLENTSCDITLRAGATSQLPHLAVKKYRLPGGSFVLCHVREGKISSRGVKKAA